MVSFRQCFFFVFIATMNSVRCLLKPKIKNLVLYDGVCKFCNSWVGILLKLDRNGIFKYTALQSDVGKAALVRCGRDSSDISSIVFIDDEIDFLSDEKLKHYIKSDAVIQIVKKLGIPVHYASSLLPLGFRDDIYDIIATNRYNLMGKYDECRLYDIEYEDRFLK